MDHYDAGCSGGVIEHSVVDDDTDGGVGGVDDNDGVDEDGCDGVDDDYDVDLGVWYCCCCCCLLTAW